jgi:hypothetical protein
MDFITFNTENTKFVDGDFIKDNDIADKVYEDGSFTLDDQWMSFDCNGVSIVVDYEISVSGSSSMIVVTIGLLQVVILILIVLIFPLLRLILMNMK